MIAFGAMAVVGGVGVPGRVGFVDQSQVFGGRGELAGLTPVLGRLGAQLVLKLGIAVDRGLGLLEVGFLFVPTGQAGVVAKFGNDPRLAPMLAGECSPRRRQ